MSRLELCCTSYKEMCLTGNGIFLHLEVAVWHLAVRIENTIFSMITFSNSIGTCFAWEK